MPCCNVQCDADSLQDRRGIRYLAAHRHLGELPGDGDIGLGTDDTIGRTAQTEVCDVPALLGEDPLIGGLHMGVGPYQGRDLPIEVEAQGLLLFGILRMEVNQDERGLLAQFLHMLHPDPERAVDGRHLHASLQVEDSHLGPLDVHHHRPMPRSLGRIVGRTQEALLAIEVATQVILLPDVVPTGDDIDSKGKELFHKGGRKAKAIGSILAIDDDHIGTIVLDQRAKSHKKRPASGLSADIPEQQGYKRFRIRHSTTYLAYSTTRISRMMVTLILPG